jgi:hypothetical protein
MQTQSLAQAQAKFQEDCDPGWFGIVTELIGAGLLEWRADPEHPGVYGLLLTGTNQAIVVIYSDGSWESDEERLIAMQQ